jgi:hypothetical protein
MAGIPELKRFFQEFVDERVGDLAVAGRDAARWNGRDVIALQDLAITAGRQEQIRAFGKLEPDGRALGPGLRAAPVAGLTPATGGGL